MNGLGHDDKPSQHESHWVHPGIRLALLLADSAARGTRYDQAGDPDPASESCLSHV